MYDHAGPWGSRRVAAFCPTSKSIEPVRIEAPSGPAGEALTGDVVCETCDSVLLTLVDQLPSIVDVPGDTWGNTLEAWAGRVLHAVCREEEGAIHPIGLDAPGRAGKTAAGQLGGDIVCQSCLFVLLTLFDVGEDQAATG